MNAYNKYLDRHFRLKAINLKYDLEVRHALMLDYIAHANLNDSAPNVTNLMAVKELGSEATIHSHLTTLIEGDFIKVNSQPNTRTKSLSLGKRGKQRAKEIDKLMMTTI